MVHDLSCHPIDMVTVNQHARCLGHRSFTLKVTFDAHTHTHTQSALREPLKWTVLKEAGL